MEASQRFAEKAQLSADNMEHMTKNMQDMTQDMQELTRKTKQETVSMRIITLVTLFFLPGTFISVWPQL
jgi:Mg2+ and Co2+ transporter CorA